jgi:hypothetical protein
MSRPDLKLSLFLVETPPTSAPIKGEYRISNTELRMSKLPRLGFFYFDIRYSMFCGSLFAFYVIGYSLLDIGYSAGRQAAYRLLITFQKPFWGFNNSINSSSEITFIPNPFAFSAFEPGLSPTTTKSVFLLTEDPALPPSARIISSASARL